MKWVSKPVTNSQRAINTTLSQEVVLQQTIKLLFSETIAVHVLYRTLYIEYGDFKGT